MHKIYGSRIKPETCILHLCSHLTSGESRDQIIALALQSSEFAEQFFKLAGDLTALSAMVRAAKFNVQAVCNRYHNEQVSAITLVDSDHKMYSPLWIFDQLGINRENHPLYDGGCSDTLLDILNPEAFTRIPSGVTLQCTPKFATVIASAGSQAAPFAYALLYLASHDPKEWNNLFGVKNKLVAARLLQEKAITLLSYLGYSKDNERYPDDLAYSQTVQWFLGAIASDRLRDAWENVFGLLAGTPISMTSVHIAPWRRRRGSLYGLENVFRKEYLNSKPPSVNVPHVAFRLTVAVRDAETTKLLCLKLKLHGSEKIQPWWDGSGENPCNNQSEVVRRLFIRVKTLLNNLGFDIAGLVPSVHHPNVAWLLSSISDQYSDDREMWRSFFEKFHGTIITRDLLYP